MVACILSFAACLLPHLPAPTNLDLTYILIPLSAASPPGLVDLSWELAVFLSIPAPSALAPLQRPLHFSQESGCSPLPEHLSCLCSCFKRIPSSQGCCLLLGASAPSFSQLPLLSCFLFPSVQMLVFLPTCHPDLVRQLNPSLAGNVSLDVQFCYLTVPPIFIKAFVEFQRL